MGQGEIIEFLMEREGEMFTLRELATHLQVSYSSLVRASKSVVKRDGFVIIIEIKSRPIKRLGYIENGR